MMALRTKWLLTTDHRIHLLNDIFYQQQTCLQKDWKSNFHRICFLFALAGCTLILKYIDRSKRPLKYVKQTFMGQSQQEQQRPCF